MNTENLKKEMKKIKVGHVALLCTGIFLAFAIIGTILFAAGGGLNVIGDNGALHNGFYFNVGPGTSYDVNDRKEMDMAGITSITVKGVAGDITVQAGGDKTAALLVGQCRTAGTPVHLETSVNGGALTIEVKYPTVSSSGIVNLTVTIPEAYQGDLSITNVSGSIRCESLPFRLQQVNLTDTSGHIGFGTASFAALRATTVSGGIDISGITAKTDVGTTSGTVRLGYAMAAPTSVTTISGDVAAALPSDAQFGVDFGSVSGGFKSTHPNMNASGSRGFHSEKDGVPLLQVNTISGDFRIEGK